MSIRKVLCKGQILLVAAAVLCTVAAGEDGLTGRRILEVAGVKGGLVVHLGCGDGKLTAQLRAGDGFLVHGLDADAANVERARAYVKSLGLYGAVSVAHWRGSRLPYVDNLVNLLVSEDLGDVPMGEVMRVLAPEGAAYVRQGGQWRKVAKPRPKEIDEWTHYLYDPTGNPVARDSVAGPPKHLQWVGSPAWTRHHDHMSSFNAMVSAGGRVFYILDHGFRAEIQLPSKWALTARDAFSGVVLWQRPIEKWHTQLWPLKSGPAQLPRRLVAVGDEVFATLGLDAPVSALDAATGKTISVYEATRGAEEILHSDGVLFLVVNEKPTPRPWSTKPTYKSYSDLQSEPNSWAWDETERIVMALDADAGRVVWSFKSPVAPLTLAVDREQVYFHDGEKVVCLNKKNGKRLWASRPVPRAPKIRSWFGPTLLVCDGVVVFAGGERMERHRGGKDTMTALSSRTGEVLWTAEHPPSGYDSPEDIFVLDGIVWTAPTTNRRDTGTFTGRDLHTGQTRHTFPADDGDHMPHHRCHRAKATHRYLLMSRTGIEYVDPVARHWDRNDWVRGACLYGIMPANGLTYAPQHSCACYIVAKLNGLNALAARRQSVNAKASEDDRLMRGPAYGRDVADHSAAAAKAMDWNTFRHDAARSGCSETAVPTALKLTWQAEPGGRLTSPTIAGGKVFVASIDEHTVYALDQRTGKAVWNYTTGGRVDSPPTIWQGRVLFGSADGCVYCLRAEDGTLAWRFRAAPTDTRLTAWEQVESVWPVHGSVLVHDGVVHCVAGRSMFVDGGMRYLRLDARTGKKLSETVLDDLHPDTGKPLDADVKWPNLPVALPDVLSCDGKYVYMRSQRFDLNGRRVDVTAPTNFRDQKGDGAHLFCSTGFLDDSWWHRTYWIYGKSPLSAAGGWYLSAYQAPAGRIMVCDASRVYAFGRRPQYFPRTTVLEYHLFCAEREPQIVGLNGKPPTSLKPQAKRRRPAPTRAAYEWSSEAPLLGRALVLAGGNLFVAGPPDTVNQEETIHNLDSPETATALAEQSAAYAGRKGALLLAVSADDGSGKAAWRLDSMPVFDGMAAADGCLFVSTTDGKVLCLGGEGKPLDAAPEIEPTELAPAAYTAPSAPVTKSHPDFQKLTMVQVTACELGWRLRTPSGNVGFALRKLPKPLTKQVTLKLRMTMIPNATKTASGRAPGNAFLAFGDGPDDEQLVKCGLRNAGGQCMIVQGPLLTGRATSRKADTKVNQALEAVVTVDLETQTMTMTMLGQTLEAKLERRMEAVSYVGYAVHSVASEFGKIEITGQ